MMRLFERFPLVQRLLGLRPKFYRVRRMTRVKVATGFYKDYTGIVLHRRLIFWFAINIGGEPTYIGRWHLRLMGKGSEIGARIRAKLIKSDRSPPFPEKK